jgi:hypothetical protein
MMNHERNSAFLFFLFLVGLLCGLFVLTSNNFLLPQKKTNKTMVIPLLPLPFDPKALEPFISSETIAFHYGKHHTGYVNKLNDLIKNTVDKDKSLMDLLMVSLESFH